MKDMNEFLDESAVRSLFVYLKDNLLFDSLQDELEQKQILTQSEKDDYVCKDKGEYIRCERLLKLIIRKRRCNKFVALINNMPCYNHISEKFVEFRENFKDQQTISTGAVQKTHSFILTDDMLEQHFALFYMELEPWDIADKMFQAGHISVSEHDDVTDYSQKRKRLRGLLDILKRKCLHAPFLSLLQSEQYTSLLDTLKDIKKLSYKPCLPALWIQHNFTLLQEELPYTDDEAIVLIEHIFEYFNIADVQRCTGTRRKKSKILKILLLKGETACVEFCRVVEEDLKRKDLIQKMKERSDDRIKRGKPDLSPWLRGLGIRCLQEHSELLHNELDPLYICDQLFEERAITILAHDSITEAKRRQKQIGYLMGTVIENENDCFHFFLYILQREEYKYIRETLERPASEAENVESSKQSEMRLSHHVKMVQGDVPNESLVLRIKVDGPVGTQVEHDLCQHINSDDTDILEDTVLHGQMDIMNVSLGSVVLQLRPLTDQAVQTLLNARDNNRLIEMIMGMLKKINIAQIMENTEQMNIKLQIHSVNSADAKSDCQISKTAMIIERMKVYRHELVSQLEPKALASVLSKSKSFSESINNTVNGAYSNYERVERILLLVENGSHDNVEEFITALNDLGYCEIVKLINPPNVHEKAENIRNMVTSNYKNILEEMQMTLVIETLSKCIGRVDDIKESCLPRNGNRRQRMNRFLQFILQDDHNVIEFEKVLRNNGLEELLEHEYVPEENVSAEDIEVTVIEGDIPLSSKGVLFESVITLSYNEQKKCTVKAEQLLLEQGTMSTEHLVRKRRKILAHETNPIYHQPQPLIKMKSKNESAFADSSYSAMQHKETVKELVLKFETKIDANSFQLSSICKEPNIPAEKDSEARVKERMDSLLYQRIKNQVDKSTGNLVYKSTNTQVDEFTNTRVVKITETPAQIKTEVSFENSMDTTSQEKTKTTNLQSTKTADVKSSEKRTIKTEMTDVDTLPDTSSKYLDLSNISIQQYPYLDFKERAQVQIRRQCHRDICSFSDLSLSSDSNHEGYEEIRIVLLGKAGTGKSATGNTILGEKLFESSASGSSITSRCSLRSSIRFGRKIVIVDTPGIFDTAHPNEHIQTEICKCIAITSPGPHAFILVLNVSRFTQEEQNTIDHFIKHFGENIYKYAIVLFTRRDDLEEEGKTIIDHLKTSPAQLQMLVKKCGGRFIAFNNRLKEDKQDAQAKELLGEILSNVNQNGGKCYTNEMFEEAEKILRKREKEIASKAKEEHEKELKAIEEKIAKRYEIRHEEDAQKLRYMEQQLFDLTYTREQAERQARELKDQVDETKRQLKESKGKDKDYFQSNLERLQSDLDQTKTNEKSKALEIQKLKKSRDTAERQQREMIKKQEEEKKKLKKEMQEKCDRKIIAARDEVRREVEEEENIITKGLSWIKRKVLWFF